MCIIYIFSYSSDSGTVLHDSTEEELKNEKEVCAATCTTVEGICHTPFSNFVFQPILELGNVKGWAGGGEGRGEMNED